MRESQVSVPVHCKLHRKSEVGEVREQWSHCRSQCLWEVRVVGSGGRGLRCSLEKDTQSILLRSNLIQSNLIQFNSIQYNSISTSSDEGSLPINQHHRPTATANRIWRWVLIQEIDTIKIDQIWSTSLHLTSLQFQPPHMDWFIPFTIIITVDWPTEGPNNQPTDQSVHKSTSGSSHSRSISRHV